MVALSLREAKGYGDRCLNERERQELWNDPDAVRAREDNARARNRLFVRKDNI